MNRTMPSKPVLVGSAISGFFGALWAVWGASGLSGAGRLVLSVAGMVLGLVVVVGALVSVPRAPGGSGAGGPMFASRAYRLIVGAEVLAIVVGNIALGRLGLPEYVIAWTALVVGVHFLAFGRAFDRSFGVIGVAMVVAALAGAGVGAVGGGGGAGGVVTRARRAPGRGCGGAPPRRGGGAPPPGGGGAPVGGGGDAVLVVTGTLSAAVLLVAGGRRVGEVLAARRA